MKKLITMLLAFLLLFSTTLGVSASAVDTSPGSVPYEFGQRQYYTENVTLKGDTLYRLPQNSKMRIEKGATLYIDGELQIEGELKNYGTIVVRERITPTSRKETGTQNSRGHLTVSGTLKNYGTILVDNGTFENRPSGEIYNEGTIRLENTIPEVTVFFNGSRSTGTGSMGARLVNEKKGRIEVATQEGTGFYSSGEATVENNGVFGILPGAEARGKIKGNQPVGLTK